MLIRIGGGRKGIREYLETGKKQGREQSREDLDNRLVLSGNLELADAAIKAYGGRGEKYLHITLSFQEDFVDPETLHAITREFEGFAFAAYRPDEYIYYAEAHLPRTKSLLNKATGERIERKPHIHIVIPKVDLLSGKHLNPLGLVRMNERFIDAFQESQNLKHGLASPKDNPRTSLIGRSDILSRNKGDSFEGANKAFKAELLEQILTANTTSLDALENLARKYGKARRRNEGTERMYLNVKLPGEAKGINLKEFVFTEAFLVLPLADKRKLLSAHGTGYLARKPEAPKNAGYEAILREWYELRAKELKYINSGSKKTYKKYGELPDDERSDFLAALASEYYAHCDSEMTIKTNCSQICETGKIDSEDFVGRQDARPAAPRMTEPKQGNVSIVSQSEYAAKCQRAEAEDKEILMLKELLGHIDANRLLMRLENTLGLIRGKYSISKGSEGIEHIQCGSRNLPVSDFLTKEMHLSWTIAADILCSVYSEQVSDSSRSDKANNGEFWSGLANWSKTENSRIRSLRDEYFLSMKVMLKKEREIFKSKKSQILKDAGIGYQVRKSLLSIASMDYLNRLDEIHFSYLENARRLNEEQGESLIRKYCRIATVENIALVSSESATNPIVTSENPTKWCGITKSGADITPQDRSGGLPIKHRVLSNGDVLYSSDSMELIKDMGRIIYAMNASYEAAEACIRLALVKFGQRLHVFGNEDFKNTIVRIVAERGMNIVFDNEAMNKGLVAAKEHVKEAQERGKNNLSSERRKPRSPRDDYAR